MNIRTKDNIGYSILVGAALSLIIMVYLLSATLSEKTEYEELILKPVIESLDEISHTVNELESKTLEYYIGISTFEDYRDVLESGLARINDYESIASVKNNAGKPMIDSMVQENMIEKANTLREIFNRYDFESMKVYNDKTGHVDISQIENIEYLNEILEKQLENIVQNEKENILEKDLFFASNLNFIIIILAIISALLIIMTFTNRIVSSKTIKNLQHIRKIVREVTNGNYTARVNTIGNGELSELGCMINDMTKSLNNHIETIKRSEERYENLYENSSLLLATIDRNGRILFCNEKFANQLGYEKNEIIEKSIFEHIANSILETKPTAITSHEFLQKLEKNGFVTDVQIFFKKKDNTRFPGLISANYSQESKLNIDLTIKDSTELYFRKLLDIENSMWLKFQYDELMKLSKTKDDFLLMITHELKTPLVPIKGYVDLLLQDKLGTINEAQKQRLKVIKNSTDSLDALITQLLDAQKIELGQFTITKNQENLSELVHDTILELKPTAERYGIAIISEIEKNVSCLCDKKRIKEVLINLITNAMDFRAKEDSQIQIKLESEANKAKIVVKDNGGGMSPEKIDHLFTKFYQMDASLTREHGGTGIGLSVCKGIVEAHVGRIFAKSEGEGKGSEFHVELPLNEPT